MVFNLSETNSGGGGGTVTITVTEMYASPQWAEYPTDTTIVTDPDSPWIKYYTVPVNSLIVMFFDGAAPIAPASDLNYNSHIVTGKSGYNAFAFYVEDVDGYIEI